MQNFKESKSKEKSIALVNEKLKIKVIFRLINVSGSEVYFKQDGQRFHENQTLKLAIESQYKVNVEVKPPLELTFLQFGGEEPEIKRVSKNDDDEKSVYQFEWSTLGMEATARTQRVEMPCFIRFKDYKELNFKLQTKFYPTKEVKHITWGQKLHTITLECTIANGNYPSYVDKKLYQ
ncbi:CB1 cannabinoid receptor-interacting protein 1 [Hydra vulgaris]|uniref:CB1 cannabinoid receptor-interacting protein 1 n=1 Tax=Hydra vulgaris TaxID=6087 RepID=UPI0006411319|nr:CB1 cannabinoid receptor-interacting protein 1 [Hydra vulgaris]